MNWEQFTRRFLAIGVVLFLADWILASLTVARVLPKWGFAVANPPFGVLYTWFESHWTGTQYLFSGKPVGDGVALLILPLIAGLQAAMYAGIWCLASRRRGSRNGMQTGAA